MSGKAQPSFTKSSIYFQWFLNLIRVEKPISANSGVLHYRVCAWKLHKMTPNFDQLKNLQFLESILEILTGYLTMLLLCNKTLVTVSTLNGASN